MNETALDRARRALHRIGLDPAIDLVRVPTQGNEAWLGPDFALRVNARGDLGRLAREAAVARRLPPAALYPPLLHSGADESIEWIMTRRAPGRDLSRAWPRMTRCQRRSAIEQFAAALSALNQVNIEGLAGDAEIPPPRPPHVLPKAPLLGLLDAARDRGLLRRSFVRDLQYFVESRWSAFNHAPRVLVHGDPHFENVLWDGERISAVLDLEWARPSWAECDLETLLAFCDHPYLFVAADYEDTVRRDDYADVPAWLAEARPSLFAPAALADRLALLFISRTLTLVLEASSPAEVAPVRVQHLQATLDGEGPVQRW